MGEIISCIIMQRLDLDRRQPGHKASALTSYLASGDSEMAINMRIKSLLTATLFLPLWFMVLGPAMAEETAAANPAAADETTAVETRNEKSAVTPTEDARAIDKDYVIQAGDTLEISVWRERDLQKDVLVRPDGGINFPLVGEVIAAGKTIDQLKNELATKLTKFVPDPVVTVSVKQVQGNKIYVIGKVSRPGEFVTNRNIDVMQALSIAGGPTPFASVNKIKILRRGQNGEIESIPFKYSRVEKGKDLEQNIILRGGDIVVVP
jgi:polysaccharide export outer membrane protein